MADQPLLALVSPTSANAEGGLPADPRAAGLAALERLMLRFAAPMTPEERARAELALLLAVRIEERRPGIDEAGRQALATLLALFTQWREVAPRLTHHP